MRKMFSTERVEQARRYHPEAVREQELCEIALSRFLDDHPELREKAKQRRAAAKRRASDELS